MTDGHRTSRRLRRFLPALGIREGTGRWVVAGLALVILAVAVFLRTYRLGAAPVHWDEGVHAYHAWRFATGGTFAYEPWRHGPLLYFLTAPLMAVLGESVVLGRAVVGLVSLGMFPALYLLREDLPRPALWFAAVVLAVHPFVLETARFYRNDALLATFGLLAVGLYARFRRRGDLATSVALGVVVGLALGTKEAVYLLLPALLLPVAVVAHFDARFSGRSRRELTERYASGEHAVWGVLAAMLVAGFLYGGWPPDPTAAAPKLVSGIEYWLDQSQSGEGAVGYYAAQLFAGAPLVLGLALVGAAGTFLRPRSSWLRWVFLSWAAVVGLLLSLLGDQSWWNLLLFFPALAVLAGCGLADLLAGARWALAGRPPRPTGSGPAASALAGVCAAVLVVSAGLTVGHLPREVGGVTAPPGPDVQAEAYGLARERALETGCEVVMAPGTYAWPGPWWLRDVGWTELDDWADTPLPAVVIDRGAPVEALGESYSLTRHGPWYVYAPREGCR